MNQVALFLVRGRPCKLQSSHLLILGTGLDEQRLHILFYIFCCAKNSVVPHKRVLSLFTPCAVTKLAVKLLGKNLYFKVK